MAQQLRFLIRKKIAYFEYDIADIEQGLSDMFQLFEQKYEEKKHD